MLRLSNIFHYYPRYYYCSCIHFVWKYRLWCAWCVSCQSVQEGKQLLNNIIPVGYFTVSWIGYHVILNSSLCAMVVSWSPLVILNPTTWVWILSGDQYTMRIRSLYRAYPSHHPFGVVHWVPEQLAYATEIKSIQLHDSISQGSAIISCMQNACYVIMKAQISL